MAEGDDSAERSHEPTQRRLPLCSAGFKRFDASIEPPLVAPAPITVWISSMKRIEPFMFSSSRTTAFSRSSKSPR